MRQILALLPILTSAILASAAAHAEIGGYRVEVILFQNLQANVDAIEVDSLRNYSNIPGLTEASLPEDLEALTDRSERMEGVWRRLRNSKGYRPLVYSSWVQNNIDYYPPFRVHDEVVVDTQIRAATNIVVADLQAQDPLQAFRSTFYRLDGSVQLRLSRFLHINLDLEFRVPAQNANRVQDAAFDSQAATGKIASDEGPIDNVTTESTATGSTAMRNSGTRSAGIVTAAMRTAATAHGELELPEHDVYRLKQSRQVKTDRLQYFDSPWFGALILVIPIAAEPQLQIPQQVQVQQPALQRVQQVQQVQVRQQALQQSHLANNNQ